MENQLLLLQFLFLFPYYCITDQVKSILFFFFLAFPKFGLVIILLATFLKLSLPPSHPVSSLNNDLNVCVTSYTFYLTALRRIFIETSRFNLNNPLSVNILQFSVYYLFLFFI